MLAAGFPHTAAASSVNRFCSSGLKAVQDIANQISMGSIECGVAIGAESMSKSGQFQTSYSLSSLLMYIKELC
jgi:acetyl-CoA acyltransferase 1